MPNSERRNPLQLRLLGELQLSRGREAVKLPQSKKTRALLAYLVVAGRPERRDRLCSLLWDVADDPRGALRWSLSRLRPVVDEAGQERIRSDRDTVAFDPAGARVDLFVVRARLGGSIEAATTPELQALAGEFRGEFLEGLDLPDFHEYQAWRLAEQEAARRAHVDILQTLIGRLPTPSEALPYARTLARIDSLNAEAHALLIRLLSASGRYKEAAEQLEAAERLMRSIGEGAGGALAVERERLHPGPGPFLRAAVSEPAIRERPGVPADPASGAPAEIVGRQAELDRLLDALNRVRTHRRQQVLLITGEPGAGKTRMLSELAAAVCAAGGSVIEGAAFEGERGRPYGPWIEALGQVSPTLLGQTIRADLAPLLSKPPARSAEDWTRDRLYGAVLELMASRAHSAPPVLLSLDDMHWSDDASLEVLHYVCRMNRHRPILTVIAAREGEVADNGSLLRVIRSLRREGLLEDLALGPLTRDATVQLVARVAPGSDAVRIFEQSSGNPLYAIELARAIPRGSDEEIPATLSGLIRERVAALPPNAVELVRWAAVLGSTSAVDRLEDLAAMDSDGLMTALELLEGRALLRAVRAGSGAAAYQFSHDVVRQVVYRDLSEPRRRLMHRRIAQLLDEVADADSGLTADLVRHAALGGDAGMAARACVMAGRRCLRLFANSEAEAMARRGLRYAESLEEPDRTRRTLELIQVRFGARPPNRSESAIQELRTLSERALDYGCHQHARLGFTMLAFLNWESGDWSHAEQDMMRAEHISRGVDGHERVVAMGEAARCLTLLERDLAGAEAMLLEAAALSRRIGLEPSVISDAEGMLRLHQGSLDDAARRFEAARVLARDAGNRLDEFYAIEHLVVVELQRKAHSRAAMLSRELVAIGDKLRDGSEAPFARALEALSRYAGGQRAASKDLEQALEALRIADAKHRLAYALNRAAEADLDYGDPPAARQRAGEAAAVAEELGRPSEVAFAHVILVRAADALGDREASTRHRAFLGEMASPSLSVYAAEAVRAILEQNRAPSASRRPRKRSALTQAGGEP